MPHEFRNLQDQPHKVFTGILVVGGCMLVAMVLLVLYLRWKHPKVPREPVARNAVASRARRKGRRKH
ncbi:MAG: hypothetical protein K2Y02_02675 [Burkholderiaceae bacterium]|nr:hypothetical protein [Burkholderiaceae bacterium]